MTTKRAVISFLLSLGGLALCAQARAQVEMYPGQDVTVNPGAAGTQVLLYPGGQYMRVVPPLREPGGHYGTIHLHMPVHHHTHVAAAPQPAPAQSPLAPGEVMTPATAAAITPPPLDSTPQKKPATETASADTPQAAAGSAPQSTDDYSTAAGAAIPFSLDSSSPAPVQAAASKPAKPKPAPQTQVASTEQPAAVAAKPAQQAIAPSPSERAARAGLTKRSEIIFETNATDPAPSTLDAIKNLAGALAAAQRIELEAYGGARGDKSSDARRLSLKRALSIRQILIDDGVPAEKIDVRAMGGVDDKGPADRVDVFVRAG